MLTLVSQLATAIDAVGIGFDPTDGEIFLYGGSDAVITRLDPGGTLLGTLPRPGESSTRFDLDRADSALTLNGVAIPAGSLLAINGQTGAAEIYALDPATGAVLASLTTAFGNSQVVGGAWHAARGTFFLVQARQASGSANQNIVAEINPATGAIVNSFKISLTQFTMSSGDIEVDPFSGNLLLVSSDETSIFRIAPDGRYLGQLSLPAGITGTISGVAMNPAVEGEAFVSTTAGNVYRIAGLDTFPRYINLDQIGPDDGFGLLGIPNQPIPDDGNPDTPPPLDTDADGIGQAVGGGGDFNGDGYADILSTSTRDEESEAQEIYLVFGKADGFADVQVGSLAPAAGLVLIGPAFTQTGFGLGFAGDVNGDGFDDLVIGGYAGTDRPAFNQPAQPGRAYIVYGGADGFGTPDAFGRNVVSLAAMAPEDGFALFGSVNSQLGWSVSSAGDVNGDGLDDILIGAPQQRFPTGEPPVVPPPQPSHAYVVYGSTTPRESLGVDDLTAANGFVIASNGTGDEVGYSVAGIGDFNDDGIDDIVIGAQSGNDGGSNAGEAYVVFGKAGGGFGLIDDAGRDVIALGALAPDRGFVIQGTLSDELGNAVANAGDVNGDGIDDLIVAAVRDDDSGGGSVYLIYGRAGAFGTADGNGRNVLDPATLTAADGVRIRSTVNFDELGFAVDGAGDVNGDGFDDLIVSATGMSVFGYDPGEVYVIFGRDDFGASFDPIRMSAADGIVLQGGDAQDRAGYSVAAAGDVDGDGYDDLIIGAPNDDTAATNAGQAYILFGRADWGAGNAPPPIEGTSGPDTLNGTAGDDRLEGLGGNDLIFAQQGGDDEANGGDGSDGLYFGAALTTADRADGGAGIDTLAIQGNYAHLVLGASITGIEVLLPLPGNDNRFGDTSGAFYDYVVATVDANVAAGGTLTVTGGNLRPGEDLTFNGAAESDGKFRIFAGQGTDNLTGGAGNDGFFFGADGNLTGADRVTGGAGTDTIALRGNYFGAAAIVFQDASFTGIEVVTFLSGHTNEFGGFINLAGFDYEVTLANGNVAAGQRLDVIASTLRANESARVDARAELDGVVRILAGAGDDHLFGGAGNDILYGGLGADALDGGGGSDSYVYRAAAESTPAARDMIAFAAGDKIDLGVIDANGAAAGDGFAFIGSAAFSNVAGELRVTDVGGGQWLVEGDVNGDGAADLVIAVTAAAPLVAGDFVL